MTTRVPYNGPHRKLVLAFDVGTTFSGISYSILSPGEVPEIRVVTRFPAQEHIGGDSKIPTVVYYDKEGNVRAVGAEAMREGVEDDAEEEGWTKAEWCKLHLRPETTSTTHDDIPPLPEGKTAIEVFADFLRYLHQCSRIYIEQTHKHGRELWSSVEFRTEFVLTHPNGWEGGQQSLMRKAAVMAGLAPDTQEGHSRLSFITEGEASLHFCLQSGLTNEAIKSGKGVLIVDAREGTIDISAYRQTSPTVQSFEEIAAPQCHFQGSIFVTSRAGNFLKNLLQDSKFSADVPHIIRTFDKTAKLRFRSPDEPQYIKVGSTCDQDSKYDIRCGQLQLSGTDVASFFDPSVESIIKSIEDQCKSSTTGISSVFLVGSFAASDYLFNRLSSTFAARGLDVRRPDRHVNKVVADGAIAFYFNHFVATRVAKFAYGVEVSRRYQPWNTEHSARSASAYTSVTGHRMIGGIFHPILPKNTRVSETQEFRQSYRVNSSDRRHLGEVSMAIYCYRGTRETPEWMDTDPSMFSTLCHVQGDTSRIMAGLEVLTSERGKEYFEVCFDIVLALGLTELKAYLCWDEHGVERRSPAEVVYEPDTIGELSRGYRSWTPIARDQTPVAPEKELRLVETVHASELQDGRGSAERLGQHPERQEQIRSLEENPPFQTLVETTQGDLMNHVNRSNNLQRQVKQLTSEKDVWLSEKTQMIAMERAKEEEIWELDENKRRQEGEIQSLKEEIARFQTLVKTAQGALVSATNRSENLQRQVKRLTSEKDIWLSEKSQMIARERAKEKEIQKLDETKRRQDGEIQSLKGENATFQTLVKTTQGALKNADGRYDDLQRQVRQLASEKDIWLSEKSQMVAREWAKEKENWELRDEIQRLQENLRRADSKPYEQIDVSLKPEVALASVLALAGPAASSNDAKPAAQDGSDGWWS